MEKELIEFLERNREPIKIFKNLKENTTDLPIEALPIEYQEIIKKSKERKEKLQQARDKDKAKLLLKFFEEEAKEKKELSQKISNYYLYLLSIEKNRLKDVEKSLFLDFISLSLYKLGNIPTPLSEYIISLLKINKIQIPSKDLEKFLNPIDINIKLSKQKRLEILEELYKSLSRKIPINETAPVEEGNEVIKKKEEVLSLYRNFLKEFEEETLHLIYFSREFFSRKNYILIIEDEIFISHLLIDNYLREKFKIKETDLEAFTDKAIVGKDIKEKLKKIEKVKYEFKFNKNETFKIEFNPTDVLESILNKYQTKAEIKRKEKEEKEKQIDRFYKSYNKSRTQIQAPHIITRNNPYLLTPETLEKGREVKITSYWGNIILEATKDTEILTPIDIKNILIILAISSSFAQKLNTEGLDEDDILKTLSLDGIYIPLPFIAEIREIEKRKKNYKKIIESVDKAQKIQIKGKLSTDIRGEPLKVEKAFSLISEYEEITYKNKKTLNIRLSPTVANLIIENKGKPYNRKLINALPDNLLPLYFFLDQMRLNKNKKELSISKEALLINSRIAYGKTAKERPDKAYKYLKEKLNTLKKGITISKDYKEKIIKDWKEIELHNGKDGIKLIFEEN